MRGIMKNKIIELSRDMSKVNDEFLDSLAAQDITHPYYPFLYRLVKLINPKITVELGVCTGRGTAHLAACNKGKVIAIDPEPWDIQYIISKYKNIDLHKDRSDSKVILDNIKDKTVDICYIDTLHDYHQVLTETKLWLPKMKNGGIILYDDIILNDGMKRFWNELQLDKVELNHLHWSGFGFAII